jgi:putative sigma-54 modulation protein
VRLTIVDRSKMLDDLQREFIQRRILFALSRFEVRLRGVSVVLTDENGPRGGVDKTCRIKVRLRRLGDIVVTDRDREVAACVSRAAERAGRAVQREVERQRRPSSSSFTLKMP